MNIQLPEELHEFVESQVQEGGYHSASEYVRDLLKSEEKRKARERLENLLIEGLNSPTNEKTKEDWEKLKNKLYTQHENQQRA